MKNQEKSVKELADQIIADPKLLVVMDDDRMFLFSSILFQYDQEKAHKIMNLKYSDKLPDLWVAYMDLYNDSQLNGLENQSYEG